MLRGLGPAQQETDHQAWTHRRDTLTFLPGGRAARPGLGLRPSDRGHTSCLPRQFAPGPWRPGLTPQGPALPVRAQDKAAHSGDTQACFVQPPRPPSSEGPTIPLPGPVHSSPQPGPGRWVPLCPLRLLSGGPAHTSPEEGGAWRKEVHGRLSLSLSLAGWGSETAAAAGRQGGSGRGPSGCDKLSAALLTPPGRTNGAGEHVSVRESPP